MIQKVILDFHWKRAFSNNSLNRNISLFYEYLKNICCSYVPYRKITMGYRKPKWMAPKILAALKKISTLPKKYIMNPSRITQEQLTRYSKY